MIVVVVAERSGGGYIGVGLVVVDRVLEVVSGSLDLVFDPGPGALGGPLGPGLLEKVLDDSVGGPFFIGGCKTCSRKQASHQRRAVLVSQPCCCSFLIGCL